MLWRMVNLLITGKKENGIFDFGISDTSVFYVIYHKNSYTWKGLVL